MNKVLFALAAVFALNSAYADCGGGNGSYDPPSNGCKGGSNSGSGGSGGAGGNGGTLNSSINNEVTNINKTSSNSNASASGVGIGVGGSATSKNTNKNNNQAVATGGKSSSNATGGSATASIAAGAVTNNNSVSGGKVETGAVQNSVSAAGGQGGAGGSVGNINVSIDQSQTVPASTTQNIQYSGEYKLKNVPNVEAPALTSSNDTCMGSSSIGASGVGIGLSVGSTWTDNNCKMLKNSRELWNMGFKAAALNLMCTDDANREALEMSGFVCPKKK